MHRSTHRPVTQRRQLLSGLLLCLSLAAVAAYGQGGKPQNNRSQGKKPIPGPIEIQNQMPAPAEHSEIYTDRDGVKHPWAVTAAHTLMWDKAPYIPVGGAFSPRSLSDVSEAAWQADTNALSTLKAKGLLDVLISPPKSLPELPATALQRLIDYLDSNGFRYGLGFGPGITRPLTGTVVKPANYRYFEADSLTASWRVSNADNGLVTVLEDSNSGDYHILQATRYGIKDDFLAVPLEPMKSSGKLISLLYPHKIMPTGTEAACPDLWGGYDDYRDRLLTYMARIKFGKGLRFLLDPLARHLGLANEYESLIPDSEAFRLEWESWLERNFPSLDDARARWAMADAEAKSYEELARYVPLWLADRGLGYLYDPQGDHMIRVDSTKSRFWEDFRQFRNESVANYMRSMAEVLKHQVVDVPVVYTWTENHPIFLNGEVEGFDGLSVATSGKPSIAGQLGPALSAVEQAARPIWYVAAEISPNAPAPGAVSPDPPPGSATTASRIALFGVLDTMQRTGVKGFFAGSAAPDSGAANAAWLNSPERIDWLHDYAMQLANQRSLAVDTPRILPYPQSSPGPAHTGPVPGAPNVLWIGSQASGVSLDLWPSFAGYVMQTSDTNQVTVLVSNKGPRTVHCTVPDNRTVRAWTADGAPVPIKLVGKSGFIMKLDVIPTIIQSNGQHVTLQEACEDALAQFETLVSRAASLKPAEVPNVKAALYHAEESYAIKNYDDAYIASRDGLSQLLDILRPYIWIEGESVSSKAHTFDDVAVHPEVSGERYLRVSNPNPPSKYGYGAHWEFDAVDDGRYNVWIACSVPAPNISPIRWGIDSPPNLDPVDLRPHGPLYAADQFGWILLGAVNLKHGRHVMEIDVINRAVSPPIYNFGVDAIVLTRGSFEPNGTMRPVPEPNASLQSLPKQNRKATPR